MGETLKAVVEDNDAVHHEFEVDITKLKAGHAVLSQQIAENTALTRQAIVATRGVEAILITLKTLMVVAKWVSAVAIAVTSVWGLVILVLGLVGNGSDISPK